VSPALLLYSIHDCIDRYLISQGVVKPSLIVATICSGLAPLFAWYFVSHLDLGLTGAGYAYTSVQASVRRVRCAAACDEPISCATACSAAFLRSSLVLHAWCTISSPFCGHGTGQVHPVCVRHGQSGVPALKGLSLICAGSRDCSDSLACAAVLLQCVCLKPLVVVGETGGRELGAFVLGRVLLLRRVWLGQSMGRLQLVCAEFC